MQFWTVPNLGQEVSPANIPKILVCPAMPTVNGVATFYLSDDWTPEGVAVFAKINGLIPAAQRNVVDPAQFPFCSIRDVSENLKTVQVSVGVGSDIAPDGTLVYLTAIGV
jgi:hypothetical protein